MKNELIKILQQNARISNTALGEMLGISPAEAESWIKKLEDEGVIRGYSVILDDDKYDKSTVHATIELKVTPQRDCGFDDIAKTIMMYNTDGTNTNLFNFRNKTNSIFRKIPAGNLEISWDSSYGVDLTIYRERSEPKGALA